MIRLCVVLLVLSTVCSGQEARFDSETGKLIVPDLVVDETRVFRDVELTLDLKTGQFTVDDLVRVDYLPPQQAVIAYEGGLVLQGQTVLGFVLLGNDSRCPSDVNCITAGEVTVYLQLLTEKPNDETLGFTFPLTLGADPSTAVRVINGIYIRLLGVDPYPISTEQPTPEDYSITVEYALPE